MFHKSALFFVMLLALFVTSAHAQIRYKQSVNDHWQFRIDSTDSPLKSADFQGKSVNIPHTWNDKDALADGQRGYFRGIGWYYKKLDINPEKGKRYFIHFEGANQLTEVYINRKKAGSHIGGYTSFTFDITDFLEQEENEILIKVDNSHHPDIAPLSADFTFFGGIYRDVYLIETSETHFDMLNHGSKGIFVSTPEIQNDYAVVSLKGAIENRNEFIGNVEIQYKIFNAENSVAAETTQRINLKNYTEFGADLRVAHPNLWSPDSPYRYRAELSIIQNGKILDEETVFFGIRNFSFDADKGFILNGEPLKLIGANRHQDYIGTGNALPDEIHRNDLRLLKEMGANFLRLAHYPQDPAVLEEADKLGLLIWEEIPLVNEITISGAHQKNAENMLYEMIRQHYNHPSVILWGYMNEIYWSHRFLDNESFQKHTEATLGLAIRLEEICRQEDPSRYTAMAMHHYPLYEESGLDRVAQVAGWNLYHGWYYDEFEDFGRFMDEQHRKYPERIHIISEFGAGSDTRLHSQNPEKFDFTIEGHKRMMESYLKQIMERPFIAGASVWNFIDFSSERRIDTNPHINNKGLLTSDRKIKDPYYIFKAYLSKKPFLKIAETNRTSRAGYRKKENQPAVSVVDVYTNLEKVELFLNGKSLGEKNVNDKKASWQVEFLSGKNKLTARSQSDNHEVFDHLEIDFRETPFNLKNAENLEIAVNAGSNHSFFDEQSMLTWVEDKPYEPGSWGFIGGEPLYIGGKIGSNEDILTAGNLIPLYQTMRQGADGYRFDVKDGWYEVELLFVEPYPKPRNFAGEIPDTRLNGQRIFDVVVNEKPILQALDLFGQNGYNYPLRKKLIIKAENNKGIEVRFNPIKGKSLVSGIKVREM